MKRKSVPLPLLVIAVGLFAAAGISARQAQDSAEIRSPRRGSVLSGTVRIVGSASHPQFQSYSVSYAPQPISAGGWTQIVPPQPEPVPSGLLAEWHTAELAPARYQIRLIVEMVAGEPLVATVSDLQVEPPGAADTGSSLTAGSPSSESAESSPPPAPSEIVLRILAWGAGLAAVSLLLFGAYSYLRPAVRDYLGRMRARHMHRERRERHSQDEPRS